MGTYLVVALVAFRVANALFVRTYFNPDEFWQSSEVAHHMVFGYGYLTWEWQPHARLRGYAHPSIFALLYKILEMLGVFTAMTDFFVYKLAQKYFDSTTAKYTLFCQLSSWFTFFAMSRTFSNSMEACCTTIALSFWPWNDTGSLKREGSPSTVELRQQRLAFAFAALGCVFRPTNAVLWVFLSVLLLWRTSHKASLLLRTILPIGIMAIIVMLVIDRIGYGVWTFVPFNFVKFNVLEGKDKLYGVHPWYWYFVAMYPEITATFLPFILYGAYISPKRRELGAAVLWALSIFSLGAHKEPRFLLPLLPASFVYAGKGMRAIESKRFFKPLVALIVLLNGTAAVYFSRFHQRAPLDVMDFLAGNVKATDSIDFLLPCHATPFLSHLHQNISTWFPTCAPEERENDNSPSDQLRRDPLGFARRRYVDPSTLPTHLVMYSSSAKVLKEQLAFWKFELQKEFAHSTISMDADVAVPDTHMLVYQRVPIGGHGNGLVDPANDRLGGYHGHGPEIGLGLDGLANDHGPDPDLEDDL
ncbi:unnamed protein product [Aphanomyces euteiches]